MEHKLIIAELFNKLLRWVLSIVGIQTTEGKEIIPGHVVMALIVTALIIVFFLLTV